MTLIDLANPTKFLSLTARVLPWLAGATAILLLVAILAMGLAWHRDHQRLTEQLYDIQNPATSWGVRQVTGPPNTSGFGDIQTAWASATQDDQEEWLQLEYEKSVVPTAILVHETYNPGPCSR